MADNLSVVAATSGGWTVLTVIGEIDVSTVAGLRSAVDEVTSDSDARLVFDLTGVSFIDSSGLSVLVGASKTLRHGCVRAAGTKRLRELMRITGLHAVIPLFDTADQAISADGSAPGPGPTRDGARPAEKNGPT